MKVELVPTDKEVLDFLIETIRHSCRVEHYLHQIGVNSRDPQRPHDLVGIGNKLDFDVIRGLSLGHRPYNPCLDESLRLHRQQIHHLNWNYSDSEDKDMPKKGVFEEDMYLGAVDAVCSRLERRSHQGGIHTYEQIIEVVKEKSLPHQRRFMLEVIPEMRKINPLSLEEKITSLNDFPSSIGMNSEMYERIIDTTRTAVKRLKEVYGYHLV